VSLKQIVDAIFILVIGLVIRMDSLWGDDIRIFMLSTIRWRDYEAL